MVNCIIHTFPIRTPKLTYREEIKPAIFIINYQIDNAKRDQIKNNNFKPHAKPDSVIVRYFEAG
jgi:hypothetical protein